jgi:hypothetical protein
MISYDDKHACIPVYAYPRESANISCFIYDSIGDVNIRLMNGQLSIVYNALCEPIHSNSHCDMCKEN